MEQTDSCQSRGERRHWKKEGEGIGQRPYTRNPQADHSVGRARGKKGGVLGEVFKGGGNGDICNSVHNKNKVKSKIK